MKLDAPEYVTGLINRLENHGTGAWLVGGCVRDMLLKTAPHDFDIATAALPDDVKRLFDADCTVIETGVAHGTVTIYKDGHSTEITTLRSDGDYSDHRHPQSVEFVSDITQDLKRRDFTINAMALSSDGTLIDPFYGRRDIKNKTIRAVGSAHERFCEDALRILRALRFASRIGFEIENETAREMISCKELLKSVSGERIYCELKQILCGSFAVQVCTRYAEILFTVIPELKPMAGFTQNNPHHAYDVYEHSVRALRVCPKDYILRLAVFFHDIGKPETYTEDKNGVGHFYSHERHGEETVKKIMRRLKTSRNDREAVAMLVAHHGDTIPAQENTVRRLISKYGYDFAEKLAIIKRCDISAQSPKFIASGLAYCAELERLIAIEKEKNACTEIRSLNISGRDIIALGVAPGKEIGIILNELLDAVIEEKVLNSEKELLAEAVKIIRQKSL